MAITGARKRLADLGAVASGLAHEIRNPLNSLHINSQLLVEMLDQLPELPAEKREELLSVARSNMKVTQRLNDLLSEFLRFARPPAMDLVVTDLNRVVADTLRFVEVDLSRREIDLSVRYHPEPLTLFADEKQLRQALLNILINAEEALDREPRRIAVETGLRGGRPFVRVHDSGRGIPRADRRQVFRLFFTTRRDGSGLGLPIVRQIVRQLGGTVGIRSREGHGTSVTLALPPEDEAKRLLSASASRQALPERIR